MLKVGDTVRYTNKYLNSIGLYWNGHKYCKGKQKLMKVVYVYPGRWNWRVKKFHQCVRIDDGKKIDIIDISWIEFVRRNKFNKTQEYKQYCKEMFG